MGKLGQVVMARKDKIISNLILKKVYQPADRPYLSHLPLENLEKMNNDQDNEKQ